MFLVCLCASCPPSFPSFFWSPLWVAPGPRLPALPCVFKRMFFLRLNCLSWFFLPPRPLKCFVVCGLFFWPWMREKKPKIIALKLIQLRYFHKPDMKWEKLYFFLVFLSESFGFYLTTTKWICVRERCGKVLWTYASRQPEISVQPDAHARQNPLGESENLCAEKIIFFYF